MSLKRATHILLLVCLSLGTYFMGWFHRGHLDEVRTRTLPTIFMSQCLPLPGNVVARRTLCWFAPVYSEHPRAWLSRDDGNCYAEDAPR